MLKKALITIIVALFTLSAEQQSQLELTTWGYMVGVKSELTLSADGISNNGRKLLRDAFENYVDKSIENAEMELEFLRSDPYTNKDYSYSQYNAKAVISVINDMLSTLQADSFEHAVNSLLDNCRSTISAKAQSQFETLGKIDKRYAENALDNRIVSLLYAGFNGFAESRGISGSRLAGGGQFNVTV